MFLLWKRCHDKPTGSEPQPTQRAAVSGCPKNAALLVGLGRAAALQALPLRLLAPLDCGLENFEMRTPIGLLSDIVVFVPLVSISN